MRACNAVVLAFVSCISSANCVVNFARFHDLADDGQGAKIDAEVVDGQRFASELEQAVNIGEGSNQTIAKRSSRPHVSGASEGITVPGEATVDRQLFMGAQTLFDAASHNWESEDETAIRRELRLAMPAEISVGSPSRVALSKNTAETTPDFSKCPNGWQQRGSMCYPGIAKRGPCASRIDLGVMSADQKLAYEHFCKASFPRVLNGECDADFEETCPSQWQEVAQDLCEAPDTYNGGCRRLLNTSGMTATDKRGFAVQCGTSWPCVVLPPHNYQSICPEGWNLQFGDVCRAPAFYSGPCAETSNFGNLSIAEKQHFEEFCNVSWPREPVACKRNYNAHCPYGWLGGTDGIGIPSCTAPPTYNTCARVKSFAVLSPAEKREWEHACRAPFPCVDRSSPDCTTVWASPCPAEWSSVDDEGSCVAPDWYSGNCSRVLRGLQRMTLAEKRDIVLSCGVSWPCLGEVGLTMQIHG
jgi:CPW-WPC domain-containing protein